MEKLKNIGNTQYLKTIVKLVKTLGDNLRKMGQTYSKDQNKNDKNVC